MVKTLKTGGARRGSGSSSQKQEEEDEEEDQDDQRRLNIKFQEQLDALMQKSHHETTPSYQHSFEQTFGRFKTNFLNDSDERTNFLTKFMSPEQLSLLSRIDKMSKEADRPSPESNALAIEIKGAMGSKKKCASKGATERPDATLKTKLVMKALLKSIFMVSAD